MTPSFGLNDLTALVTVEREAKGKISPSCHQTLRT
jgi:hypothetical protein